MSTLVLLVFGGVVIFLVAFALGRSSMRAEDRTLQGKIMHTATSTEARRGFLGDISSALGKTLDELFLKGGSEPAFEVSLDRGTGSSTFRVASSSGNYAVSGVVSASGVRKAVTVRPKTDSPANASGNTEEKPGTSSGANDASSSAPPENKNAETKKNALPAACSLSGGSPSHTVLLNEIAWMGSPVRAGDTDAQAANNEWMELKNNSDGAMLLSGWRLTDSGERIKIVFDGSQKITKGGTYLLERTDDFSVAGIPADAIYSGALANDGMHLALFDDHCTLVDEIDASGGWPGGDKATKQTLERDVNGFGWHTSAVAGGTPRAENSTPFNPAVGTSTLVHFPLAVSRAGDGSGTVVSNPAGILCGTDCFEEFALGAKVSLTASSSPDSKFTGWSGACSGKGACTAVLSAPTSVTALFYLINPPPLVTILPSPPPAAVGSSDATTTIVENTSTPAAPSPPPPPPATGPSHVVISAVQIVGPKTDNDFIKVYNPTGASVDMSNWKLRKRTKTGGSSTEASIRVFPTGSIVAAGGYFLWANSGDGFSASIGANVSSTATLASDNSIALELADGTVVDALAWGSGHINPFVEGNAYPDNPTANQSLVRKTVSGIVQDTDSNSSDFQIQ